MRCSKLLSVPKIVKVTISFYKNHATQNVNYMRKLSSVLFYFDLICLNTTHFAFLCLRRIEVNADTLSKREMFVAKTCHKLQYLCLSLLNRSKRKSLAIF